MDEIDKKIIEVLKNNSRATTPQISKSVHLSIPAVAERIRKLEDSGVLQQFTVKVSRGKTGFKLLAYVFLSLEKTEHVEPFRKLVITFPQVLECHHVAGEFDYLLKVAVEDTNALEDFLSHWLKKIKGVVKSNTIIALSTLKEDINRPF